MDTSIDAVERGLLDLLGSPEQEEAVFNVLAREYYANNEEIFQVLSGDADNDELSHLSPYNPSTSSQGNDNLPEVYYPYIYPKPDKELVSEYFYQTLLETENIEDYNAECTLIITEGRSANNIGLVGLSILGRGNYGLFPLNSNILNTRTATERQITQSHLLSNLKK